MSDAQENLPSFLENPGEPVPEVDPDDLKAFWQVDLKTFWQEMRNLQAGDTGQHVAIGVEAKAIAKPGVNFQAVWYRSMMIRLLKRLAHEQLAPWIKDGEVSDAVFRTMATIPMESIGPTEREGLPFDVEEFFRRLSAGGVQND